jgi:hypothetical protein
MTIYGDIQFRKGWFPQLRICTKTARTRIKERKIPVLLSGDQITVPVEHFLLFLNKK